MNTVSGSPTHLEKMVMNLIINAFEAITGRGTVIIETANMTTKNTIKGYETIPPGDYVVLKISDNGNGIPLENMTKIFEPFYSSKIMGRSGSGLGMTVVWGVVKDHNGYLDITSSRQSGTTFSVFLPSLPHEIKPAPPVTHDNQVIPRGDGERILMVDDLSEQRSLVSTILSTLGYIPTTASSGEEAVEILGRESFDLVILDMIMAPGMDGLDTYREILKTRPGQKVIIVSGYSETERMKTARELGVRRYIKKPYTLKEVATGIREELRNVH